MIFEESTVSIQDKASGREVRRGSVENGVYKLDAIDSVQNSSVGELWPYKSGHMKFFALRQAFQDQLVDGLPDDGARQRQCISCIHGKQHSEAFPKAHFGAPGVGSHRRQWTYADSVIWRSAVFHAEYR